MHHSRTWLAAVPAAVVCAAALRWPTPRSTVEVWPRSPRHGDPRLADQAGRIVVCRGSVPMLVVDGRPLREVSADSQGWDPTGAFHARVWPLNDDQELTVRWPRAVVSR